MVATKMTKINSNKPKKILMISADLNRQCGVDKVMLNLGQQLYKKGHNVHIVTVNPIIEQTFNYQNIYIHEIYLSITFA